MGVSPVQRTDLKAFGLGIAPEGLKTLHFLVDGVHDDEREEAIIHCFLEGLEETLQVGFLHVLLILILQDLGKKTASQHRMQLCNLRCVLFKMDL